MEPSNPPLPIPIQANPISSFPSQSQSNSSRKLPIKRKNPNSNSNSNSNSTLILTIPNSTATSFTESSSPSAAGHPPFKFHRIWSEPDEIRLLQSLLHSSSQGLSFPRDLGIFYSQFSNQISQSYTKSQLSEKLRRLRKKFRVISSRLANGLDVQQLSVQDRTLYELSKQLWDPEKPKLLFGGTNSDPKPIDHDNDNDNDNDNNNDDDNCKPVTAVLALPSVVNKPYDCNNGDKVKRFGRYKHDLGGDDGRGVKMVGFENENSVGNDLRSGIVRFATTTLADVLDRSLKEMRVMVDVQRCMKMEKEIGFEKRWRDQHVAEFDVLAKRLKLVLERSSMVSK